MAKNDINIGFELRQILEQQGIKIVWLAKQLDCDDSNLNKWLHKKHIYPELLLKISIILKINLFEQYNRAFADATNSSRP